tara:strand:- start:5066 stop:5782 length:717 start_codon:yes stop_codon:yes gene_type:complete
MGYLDNSTIVVDAVLTKEGRKRLAQGQGLDIQYFTLSDSGIDYRLWNPDHPSGSAFYGEAIENLPSLEAIPRGEFYLRNKLVTLNQSVTGLPYWEVGGSTDFQTIVLNALQDPDDGNGNYNGVEVQFKLNQTTAGQCMLIIGDVSAVDSVVAGATSNFSLNHTTDPDGVNYNTLVNIEAHTPGYWTFTPGNSTFYLNFKRPNNMTTVVTNCMLVDISTGIYRTFQLDVSGIQNDGNPT